MDLVESPLGQTSAASPSAVGGGGPVGAHGLHVLAASAHSPLVRWQVPASLASDEEKGGGRPGQRFQAPVLSGGRAGLAESRE
eukprot:6495788-Pyramimonas_sp.AAC.1